MVDDPHDLEEDPAAAFEALRAEVATLRTSVEQMAPRSTPDYAPTLGEIADTLAKIESHPALRSTPEGFVQQLRQAREAAQQQGGRELNTAVQQVQGTASQLQQLLGGQRTIREQDGWLLIMVVIGAVVGMVVWTVASGPIARALPASWAVPEKMAAATLHLDRWQAGEQMMASANAQEWGVMADSTAIVKANLAAVQGCLAASSRTGRPQRCAIQVVAPPRSASTR